MQGSPLVLVIEDDQLIQSMVKEALTEGGFEAATSATAESAIDLLNLNRGEKDYRALVTDINLIGELTGWDVARVAREKHPDIPVVYMTGAAADEWTSKGVPKSVLLCKPFAPAQLVTAVAQLLNAGGGAT